MTRAGRLLAFAFLSSLALPALASDCVILLHGLGRSAQSMRTLANALTESGYTVVNNNYPSRKHEIAELAPLAIEAAVDQCRDSSNEEMTINFVTHSIGGILVRHYYQHADSSQLGRVVMLAPPNHGSEVVDAMRGIPGYRLLNGRAGLQLGTDSASVPRQLGPVDFEVGVIAGSRTINMLLSQFLPNPDDGKVSVESARLDGMSDFLVVPHSHAFIMSRKRVIKQVIHFLKEGAFQSDEV